VSVTVLDGCTVVTVDAERHEYAVGHVVIDGTRIRSVAPGRFVPTGEDANVIDGSGCVLTPGLVNTHHHLYQWATRGYAVDATLFEWLTALYPVWGNINEQVVGQASAAGIGHLALSGCTTVMDHHYVFPRDGGDVLGAEIAAAGDVGVRFFATRGSMDLGRSDGGLPPDHVVESIDEILRATSAAIETHHDASPDAMVRVGVAPCSPFSVTTDLLREAATLARDRGVRLHTHLAETLDEEDFCRERFGQTPIDYMESLGWLGGDVWFAHGIHFDDKAIQTLARTGTGVAHCPSSNARLGAGVCRTRDLLDAGVPVGLGVDGAASNEATSLLEEARHALLFARSLGGPTALGVRQALEAATIGGARLLGWDDQIGSIEPGKQADLCLWRMDTLAHAGIADPVAGLVLSTPPPLDLALIAGRPVVRDGHLTRVDEAELAAGAVTASGQVRAPVLTG
jgi:Cytosine deaminase and related metal-dependent hydrolases